MNWRTFWSAVLYLPWVLLALFAPVLLYWCFEPTPLRVLFVAPHFSSEPARTRDAAYAAAVAQVRGGVTVYRYVEYCISKPFTARIQRSWVGSAIVWQAPDVSAATSDEVGCFARAFAVEVPTSSPSRSFAFQQRMFVVVNQIRTDPIEYPPIPLRILSPADADRLGL